MTEQSDDIWILGNNNRLVQSLKSQYFGKKLKRVPRELNPEVSNGVDISCLIIIEPHEIVGRFVSISRVWRKFLVQNSPASKLIVMGFLAYKDSNYIDLLNLPDDFKKFIENARSAGEVYDIPIEGVDICDILKDLFRGHSDNSLFAKAVAVKQTLDIARSTILTEPERIHEIWGELVFPIGIREVDKLSDIWEFAVRHYGEYLKRLPCQRGLSEFALYIDKIRDISSCHTVEDFLPLSSSIFESINRVFQFLETLKELCASEHDDGNK